MLTHEASAALRHAPPPFLIPAGHDLKTSEAFLGPGGHPVALPIWAYLCSSGKADCPLYHRHAACLGFVKSLSLPVRK